MPSRDSNAAKTEELEKGLPHACRSIALAGAVAGLLRGSMSVVKKDEQIQVE
jgi:hypothetical protein